jgi:hypothetical protein
MSLKKLTSTNKKTMAAKSHVEKSLVVEDLKFDLKTTVRPPCGLTPGCIQIPVVDLCKCGKPKRDCKSRTSGCGHLPIDPPVAFPHIAANPGLIRSLETLNPGSCVFIIPKSTGVSFYTGTYAGFNNGSVLLVNAFNQLTLSSALVANGVTGPLTIASFNGIQTAIDLGDISSITLLNGDLCSTLSTGVTTGTFPAPPVIGGVTPVDILSALVDRTGETVK